MSRCTPAPPPSPHPGCTVSKYPDRTDSLTSCPVGPWARGPTAAQAAQPPTPTQRRAPIPTTSLWVFATTRCPHLRKSSSRRTSRSLSGGHHPVRSSPSRRPFDRKLTGSVVRGAPYCVDYLYSTLERGRSPTARSSRRVTGLLRGRSARHTGTPGSHAPARYSKEGSNGRQPTPRLDTRPP